MNENKQSRIRILLQVAEPLLAYDTVITEMTQYENENENRTAKESLTLSPKPSTTGFNH